jgi:excisionase family DNA binding protein
MAQKYLNSQEAADVLGVSVDEVKRMIDARELHGYRDGSDWKFKFEDIERKARDVGSADAGDDDVLLSETELGGSGIGTSGTVIGMKAAQPTDESDLQLSSAAPASPAPKAADDSRTKFDELDLTLDDDLSLDDASPAKGNDSAIDLGGKSKLDDDELVLGGGSGVGSDITLGGDSGISLVDPADSGLSLEQPLDLGAMGEESLELGEDDMLTLAVEGSGVRMKGDDEFLLTPLDEAADGEDSESGSQVIALDTEGDDAATMIGGMPGAGMAAMLEEDLSSMSGPMAGMGAPMGGPMGDPSMAMAGGPMMPMGPALPETPYTPLNIASLVACALLLMICGMFMWDLVRNMWSWDSAYGFNSSMMDTVIGWFEKS